MKKLFIAIMMLCLILPLVGKYRGSSAFLATAVDVNAGITKTNGTDFTSVEVNVTWPPDIPDKGMITMAFTRAAGSATLTVDYYFQVSYDGGTTWADFHDPIADADYLSIVTAHAVISGTTVRVSRIIPLNGVSHIRFSKVINNDTSNALTAVNATLSW